MAAVRPDTCTESQSTHIPNKSDMEAVMRSIVGNAKPNIMLAQNCGRIFMMGKFTVFVSMEHWVQEIKLCTFFCECLSQLLLLFEGFSIYVICC